MTLTNHRSIEHEYASPLKWCKSETVGLPRLCGTDYKRGNALERAWTI